MQDEFAATPTEKKYKWCKRVLVFVIIILFMRLFDLQILKGEEMRRLSEQNRVRIKKILAPRGTIFDRKGRILGNTRPSFNLYVIPEDIKDFTETIDGLVKLLDLNREDVIAKMKDARDFPSSFAVKIESDMSMDQVAKVEANKFYLPGASIQIEPKRNYPYGEMLSHTLGYVSEVSSEELKGNEYKGKYAPGDPIGKFGLERMYEKYLRGIDGEKRVEVDASGREVRVLEIKEPVSGNGLYLNIDMDVQEALEKGLYGKDNVHKAGGGVISDPRTGGVLAIASHPSFDPNQLTSGSREYWKTIAMDPAHPLQNRAIQGRFPPGSTFKVLVALGALEKGVIDEHYSTSCPGFFSFGGHVFKCWQKKGHGAASVHKGIVESCDVFFYNTGLKLGVDGIHEWADKVGITKPTGIDLPGEKSGFVPSTAWKMKTFGQKWYPGETPSVSIGQGADWLTPIGLMQLSSFMANEGVTFKPQLVNRVVSVDGKVIKVFEPVMTANVKLSKTNIAIVKEAMKGVVNEPRGTAHGNAYSTVVSISGKTGSAQSGTGGADHAWFIAYAPSDAPTLSMGILVEHGLHGASAASPIAKAVAEVLYKDQPQPTTPGQAQPTPGQETKPVQPTLNQETKPGGTIPNQQTKPVGPMPNQGTKPVQPSPNQQTKPVEQNVHR
jgi:penicillin-binding protein 2